MRIGVLTDEGSFYAPRILARSKLRDEHEIVRIWSKTSNSSPLRRLQASAKASGLRYTADRAIALGRLKRRRQSESHSGLRAEEMEMPIISDLDSLGLHHSVIDTANNAEFVESLVSEEVDLLISLFYGEILDKTSFSTPRLGTINVHPSLLPSLAGKNPIFWVLADGADHTGVTIHRIDEGVDTGPILDQVTVPIEPGQSHHRLYLTVADVIAERLPLAVKRVSTPGVPDVSVDMGRARSYRSTPTSTAYRDFRAHGHRFL